MKAKSIINLIIQILLLLNMALTLFKINPIPFDEDELYQALSTIAIFLDGLWVWWKNMPVTDAAIHAQEVLNLEKKASKESEEFFEEGDDE